MRVIAPLFLCLGLVLVPAAGAEICTPDVVPAATLLVPYFEVDLDALEEPEGERPNKRVTTLVSILNTGGGRPNQQTEGFGVQPGSPGLAHITLWTDLSVPTLDFSVYFTGFDVVTINLLDVFRGVVPSTAPGVVPPGAFSFPDIQFPGCQGLPLPNLPQNFIDHVKAAHTGQPSNFFGGACSGVDHGDNVARGYITIDAVNSCSLAFPDTVGYFVNGGTGIASNENRFTGDYIIVDDLGAFAQAEPMVHIEAAGDDPRVTTPGNYTFYGRYVDDSAADNREPLPTTWAMRYLNGLAFSGGTDILCWRDTKISQQPFACGTVPAPFPMSQNQIVIFDEDENLDVVVQPPFSPAVPGAEILPCPWESSRMPIQQSGLASFEAGWLYLNLNTPTGGSFDPISQSYVSQIHSASGLYSVGYGAFHLDSACEPSDVILPVT